MPPEEAYGERDKALQQRVPVETFGGVDQIEPGMCFFAQSDDDRHVENVMVTEVDEDNGFVVVDTNHPLAGMTLEFEVSRRVRARYQPAGYQVTRSSHGRYGRRACVWLPRKQRLRRARKPDKRRSAEPSDAWYGRRDRQRIGTKP